MLIIELTYQKPLTEIDTHLLAHRAWLETCYQKGLLLASGPKQPRDGGIIIALIDREAANQLIREDPFHRQGLAQYRITEFEPVKYCVELTDKIKKKL